MDAPLLGAYLEPDVHEAIARIIRRHSTNPIDVRLETLRGIDLSRAAGVLDLGCGYGSMVEALGGQLPPDVEVIGVDMHASNEEPFLARAHAAGRSARFICAQLDTRLDFAPQSLDAVIAAYSLYFFPRLIPEVARVLRPEGVFVTLTHSESNFRSMLTAIGVAPSQSVLNALLVEFSAENGASRLSQHFRRVESRPYPNTLVFRSEDLADFLELTKFKLPSLRPNGPDYRQDLLTRARELLLREGRVIIEKDDAIFIATEPIPS
jgi:SAM-dependent methyltransferase